MPLWFLTYFGVAAIALIVYFAVTLAVGFLITITTQSNADTTDMLLASYIIGAFIFVGVVIYFLAKGCSPLM